MQFSPGRDFFQAGLLLCAFLTRQLCPPFLCVLRFPRLKNYELPTTNYKLRTKSAQKRHFLAFSCIFLQFPAISCIFYSFFRTFLHFSTPFLLPILPNSYNLALQPPFFAQKQRLPLKSTANYLPKTQFFKILPQKPSAQMIDKLAHLIEMMSFHSRCLFGNCVVRFPASSR